MFWPILLQIFQGEQPLKPKHELSQNQLRAQWHDGDDNLHAMLGQWGIYALKATTKTTTASQIEIDWYSLLR